MKKLLALAILIASQTIAYSSNTLISITGSTLSGASLVSQQSRTEVATKQGQFESAADFVFNLEHGNEIEIQFNVSLGSLSNETGFQTNFSGFSLQYSPEEYQDLDFLIGSINIPFGQFADHQTNNSTLSSVFIYNDLLYTLLVNNNSVTSFASNGFLTTYRTPYGTVEGMVFNGTDGYEKNTDEGFGVAVRFVNDTLVPQSTVGVSIMNSNDTGNTSGFGGVPAGINANTTGFIIDINSTHDIFDITDVEYGGYFSVLTLDDGNDDTKDNVSVFMAYISKNFGKYTLAGRYSLISPEDYDGSGSGMSAALPIMGLSRITINDVDVSRIQVSGIYHMTDSLNLHNEIVYDMYADDYSDLNSIALLAYTSFNF